jgi:hypothetical protein
LIILSIPLPLLFRVRLPKKNKAILFSVFLIGMFTYGPITARYRTGTDCASIVASVLNKYYSFKNPYGTEWTIWYLRESYTAILCANLPLIYPLIQRVFKLRNWSSGNYDEDSEYRIRTQPDQTATSVRPSWNSSRPEPAHRAIRGMVRRTDSESIMGYSEDDERANGSQFITSAIAIDEPSEPEPVKSSFDRAEEERKRDFERYHVV